MIDPRIVPGATVEVLDIYGHEKKLIKGEKYIVDGRFNNLIWFKESIRSYSVGHFKFIAPPKSEL